MQWWEIYTMIWKGFFLDVTNNNYFYTFCGRRDKTEITTRSFKEKKLSINKIKFEYYLFLKMETVVFEKKLRYNYFKF